jgi:sugar lactone lactonase YvrE
MTRSHLSLVRKIARTTLALTCAALTPLALTQRASAQVTASSQTVITGAIGNATGVAIDRLGNLYIADGASNALLSSQGSNAAPASVLTGLTAPAQLAVDTAGNLYVANGTSNQVVKIPYQSGALNVNATVTLGTGLGTVTGVAVDNSNNVYIVDATNKQLVKLASTTQTVLTTALSAPKQVAVDRLGNVYIADAGSNMVVYLPVGGGAASTVGTGLNKPSGVATDAANNIYIADTGNGRVLEIPSVSGVPNTAGQIVLTSTISAPAALTLDSRGSLYIASANSVYRYTAGGIYFGLLPVGTTSQTFPVTLSFAGPAAPAAIKVLTTGITGLDYKDAGNDTCAAGATYAAGNTCTVNVTFTPAGVGPRYGAIALYDATNKVIGRVFLGGAGLGALLTIDPGTLTALTPTVNATAPFNVLTTPHSVITDAAGNIFLAETGYTTTTAPITAYPARILEIPAGQTTATVIATQGNNGIAINGAGDLIIATGGATVLLYPNENGTLNPTDVITLGSGYARARVAKTDVAGNVLWCDASGNTLYEQQVSAAIAGTAPTKIPLTGYSTACLGVALDLYGNIAVADGTAGKVLYIPVNGTTPYETGSGYAGAWGVTFDASGSVWIGSSTTSVLGRIPNENGTLVGADQTLSTVDGVKGFDMWMDDTTGTLYTTQGTGNQIAFINIVNRLATTHAFASTAIGNTTASTPYILSDSGNQPATFTNGGTVSFYDTLDFPAVTGTSPACNFTLSFSPGFTCNLAYAYAPQSNGARSATIDISSTAVNNAVLTLTGTTTTAVAGTATLALALTTPATGSPAPGQPLLFTATATPSAATAATGPLTFYVDGVAKSSAILASNAASFSIPAGLALGSHTIGVTYAGDKNYAPITTAVTTTISIVAATSTTTLVASGTDVAVNQTVNLTATVPGITGLKTPTGTITFKDTSTSTTLGTGTLNASGVATINASFATAGTHAIQATYAGDAVYSGSTSSSVVITVGTFTATATALAVSPVQPTGGYTFGTALTAAIAVTPQTGSGTPTGAIDLLLDGSPITVNSALTSGKVALTLSSINAGTHTLVAYYSGDTTYATSASSGFSFTVVKASTATTSSTSSTANFASVPVTFTANVSNVNVPTAAPSGTVTFFVGKASLGTVPVTAGSAALTTTLLPAGTDSITAVYSGDANDVTSTSAAITDVVTIVPTTLTLTAAPSVLVSGSTSVLTATVVGSPITGSFSGTITFYNGTTALATTNVSSGGTATYTTAAITAPTTAFTATYSGNAVYATSTTATPTTVYTTDAGGSGVIATTTLGSGFTTTAGTAVDISGNLYISDATKGTVALITGGAGAQTTVASGLTSPSGLAVDGTGDLFIATGTTVTEYPSANGALSVSGAKKLGTSLGTVIGVAVDAAGNVYAADATNKQLVKIVPSTSTQTVLSSTLINPQQVAVDSLGDVYVADGTGNRVVYITATGTASTVGTGLLNPTGVTVDAYNNVYIADTGNNRVLRIPFVGTAPSTAGQAILIPTVTAPGQLTIDRHLALYIGQGTSIFKWQSGAASFGVLTPGVTSPTYTLTVTFPNAITPAAINVLSSGQALGEYATTGGTCKAGTAYTAGQSCTVTVAFTAGATPGIRPGAVTFTAAAGQPLLTVYMGGVVYAPAFYFDNPLVPLNKGVSVGTVNGLALAAIRGIAADGLGNVYLCDNTNGRIIQTNTTGSTATVLYTNTGCGSVALDGAGNLIVDDMGNNRMLLLPNENGAINGNDAYIAATGFSGPRGMTLDGFGNIAVADSTNVRVVIAPIGGAPISQSIPNIAGLKAPYDVAVDWQGNIAVADNSLNQIFYLPASGTGTTTVGPILCIPYALAMDGAGAIYTTETGSTTTTGGVTTTTCPTGSAFGGADVVRIAPGSTFYYQADGHASNDFAVALDPQGNLYTSYAGNFAVQNRTSPPLTFSATIGTPSAAQPYTVVNGGPAPATFTNATGIFYLDSLDFAVATASTQPCTFTGTFAPGAACEFGLVFNPVQTGTRTADFTPAANQANIGTSYVALTGTATGTTTTSATSLALALTAPANGLPFPYKSLSLTSTLSGGSSPTGTVSLSIDGVFYGSQKAAATNTFVIAAGLSAGFHTAIATYSGDSANTTSSATLIVSAAGATASAATLAISPNAIAVLTPSNVSSCPYAGAVSFSSCTPVTLTATVTGTSGGAIPTTIVQFEDSGVVIGQATLNAAGVATLVYNGFFTQGTHKLTANYIGDLTYAAAISPAQTLTASYPGDYTLSLNPTSLTLTAGQVSSITISAIPVTGAPGGFYNGQIGLTCTGLPVYATCAVSPNTLYLDGTGTPTAGTLSIITQAGFVKNSSPFDGPLGTSAVRLCILPGMSLLLLFGSAKLRRRRGLVHAAATRNLLYVIALAGLLSSVVACGSHAALAPKSGTYTVTVSGSGTGGVNHTVTMQVTIK